MRRLSRACGTVAFEEQSREYVALLNLWADRRRFPLLIVGEVAQPHREGIPPADGAALFARPEWVRYRRGGSGMSARCDCMVSMAATPSDGTAATGGHPRALRDQSKTTSNQADWALHDQLQVNF